MPNMPVEALKGIRGTRLGKRNCAESVIREMSPRGYVSVTPLQVDLTNYKQVPTVRGWMDGPAV